jgi:uncharacterized protein YacL
MKLNREKIANGVVIGLIVAAIIGAWNKSLGFLSWAASLRVPVVIVVVIVGLLMLVIINRQKKIAQFAARLQEKELEIQERDARDADQAAKRDAQQKARNASERANYLNDLRKDGFARYWPSNWRS